MDGRYCGNYIRSSTHSTMLMAALRFLSLIALVVVLFSGCSLFDYIQRKASQGNIAGDKWYVQKIIVDSDGVFYAPQVLATHAKRHLNKQKAQPEVLQLLTQEQIDTISDEIDASAAYDKSRLKEIAQIAEEATLNFDTTQGRISGQSGCGSYFSSYVWSDKEHIELSAGGSTRKLCSPGEIVRFEFRFIRELEGSFKVIQQSKDYLILEGKAMTIHLYRNHNE